MGKNKESIEVCSSILSSLHWSAASGGKLFPLEGIVFLFNANYAIGEMVFYTQGTNYFIGGRIINTNYSIGGMIINTQDTNYSIGGMVIKTKDTNYST